MSLSFAALLYRPEHVSERALSLGFAVALAGWDVPAPSVLTAALPGKPGWAVAFYRSGAKKAPGHDELEHAAELFEDELPPGLCVRDAARVTDAVVYALVYSDAVVHDDAWRFSEEGLLRRWVGEGEDGLEAGVETLEGAEVDELEDDDDEALRPHRGSTFLSEELGVAVLPALAAALFEADRRVPVALADPSPSGIAEQTRELVRVLRREPGRGAPDLPAEVAGVRTPEVVRAFAQGYDWADPTDPSDLYRELAIGNLEGTLRFSRRDELVALGGDAGFARAAGQGAFPLAVLKASALGGAGKPDRVVALAADHETLLLIDAAGDTSKAGPTLGELLGYLALGFKARDAIEEDRLGAYQLRAHLRAGRG